jgi:acyl-CoA thioester hydrolase
MPPFQSTNNNTNKHPDDDVFTWPARVYYEDTDAGGVVFYANYLKFFERARTEWLRTAGYSQQTLAQSSGFIFVVKNTSVDYISPARLDDELKLTVVVEQLRNASLSFIQEAWRIQGNQQRLLARGSITIVCVDASHFRPHPIPEILRTLVKRDFPAAKVLPHTATTQSPP